MKIDIKSHRERAGLSQLALAQKLGHKYNSIVAMWESGERKPPSDKLPLIATVLRCSIDDLFSEEEKG